ncbi:unnamed protein product [Arabis nemorensis]|uniref:Uncharacterized protein n=1 Tax=Arabis nemorensis TaxID=586526 RepID=A0A565BX89_9BRAS|nr:unnamed protein product [Arabis nemorensis]
MKDSHMSHHQFLLRESLDKWMVSEEENYQRYVSRKHIVSMPTNELIVLNYFGLGEEENRNRRETFPTIFVTSSKFETNYYWTLAVRNNAGEIVIWNFSTPRNYEVVARFRDPDNLPITRTTIFNDECTMVSINNVGRA